MKSKIYILIPLLLVGCSSGMILDESHLYEKMSYGSDTAIGEEKNIEVTPITANLIEKQNEKDKNLIAPRQNGKLLSKLRNYKYTVGPDDILSVTVYDHPELTIPAGQYRSAEQSGYTVNKVGMIYFPYIGMIDVGGKTVDEVRTYITRHLGKYIKDPQVDVSIVGYHSKKINITGEIKKPGITYISNVPVTVIDALNMAEGVTPEADLHNVIVARNGKLINLDVQNLYDKGDLTQNLLLEDGDIINIPDRNKNKVFVLGEVQRQSALMMNKGKMTLAEAISGADGLNITSDPQRIYVIRGNLSKPLIYKLNGNLPDAMLLASEFQLQPKDVIYVSVADVSRWNRILSQILPSLASAKAIK